MSVCISVYISLPVDQWIYPNLDITQPDAVVALDARNGHVPGVHTYRLIGEERVLQAVQEESTDACRAERSGEERWEAVGSGGVGERANDEKG
jgi:hypothetical protein